jgi:hypothetical protein
MMDGGMHSSSSSSNDGPKHAWPIAYRMLDRPTHGTLLQLPQDPANEVPVDWANSSVLKEKCLAPQKHCMHNLGRKK